MKSIRGCFTVIGAIVVLIVIIAVVASSGSSSKKNEPTVVANSSHSAPAKHAPAANGSIARPAKIGQTLKLTDDLGDTAAVTLSRVSGNDYYLKVQNLGSSSYQDDFAADASVIDASGQNFQAATTLTGPCAIGSNFNLDPTIQPKQYITGCIKIVDRQGHPSKFTFGLFENNGTAGAWKIK